MAYNLNCTQNEAFNSNIYFPLRQTYVKKVQIQEILILIHPCEWTFICTKKRSSSVIENRQARRRRRLLHNYAHRQLQQQRQLMMNNANVANGTMYYPHWFFSSFLFKIICTRLLIRAFKICILHWIGQWHNKVHKNKCLFKIKLN